MSATSNVALSDGWFAGERKRLHFPIRDSAGQPVDVSGWALVYRIKKNPKATDVMVEKTSDDDGIDMTGAAEGDVYVEIFHDDTIGLKTSSEESPATLYHELARTDVEGENVLSSGDIELNASGIFRPEAV